MRRVLSIVLALLAGCAQLPPTPADLQAKKFEAVPGSAVIYIVRAYPDFTDEGATFALDDEGTVTTYPGTYYRWETAPGRRVITGYGADLGTLTLATEPGRVYYVMQRVAGYFTRFPQSQFYRVSAAEGQAAVKRSVLAGGR